MANPTQNDGEQAPGTTAVLLQAKGLTIRTRAGVSLLSDISFHIEPGELVALTGLSRSGKSTLLQSLAGLLEPESGEILIDGVNLYANLNAFRSTIGFVPAEFALQQNLTVAEILQDAARLRLPRSVSSHDRKQRILTLLGTVRLTHVTDRRVGLLSEVEKRRLSIAVELIGYPKLLLLDESVEPLIPFEEVEITILMRELSRQGLTIIQSNARSRSAGVSDKIIFLAAGGQLAWFGPADEGLAHLKGFLPRGVVKDLFGLQEALEMLVNPQERDGIEWAKRFKDHEAYEKYVDDPLHNRYPDLLLQTRPLLRLRLRNSSKEKLPPPIIPRANNTQKLILLIRRNFRLLWRDKVGFLMLAIPPLVAFVHFMLSSTREASNRLPIVFDLFVFLVVLTAAMLVQNEIFKERAAYRREQRTSSLLFPYILSKLWLVGLLAMYQGFVWTIIHSFGQIGSAGGSQVLLSSGITLALVAFVGGILGLMVSALSGRTMPTTGWVLLLTIPQLLFIVNPLNHWSRLVLMSLFLIVLLVGIQHGTGNVRTS
ncbi:MAG: ATP-binding cassette domain-containing protein [Anaerolineae bacterium]|nr:ATP-binding cassette domain-containing protein [Anaerolineae bacterium]MCI0607754.1 ATP-binding cassette domain-containing protein [Anaerolineae bacterium]